MNEITSKNPKKFLAKTQTNPKTKRKKKLKGNNKHQTKVHKLRNAENVIDLSVPSASSSLFLGHYMQIILLNEMLSLKQTLKLLCFSHLLK